MNDALNNWAQEQILNCFYILINSLSRNLGTIFFAYISKISYCIQPNNTLCTSKLLGKLVVEFVSTYT